MPGYSTITLTPEGQAKLRTAITEARRAARDGVVSAVTMLRAQVAQAAPGPDEEAEMLSTGIPLGLGTVGFASAGRTLFSAEVGTPAGGRFIKAGMKTLQAAIAEDPVDVTTTGAGAIVTAGTGAPERINALTGFSWQTRRRGIVGPTFPFNRALLQAVENGGATWTVVPRPDNMGSLSPEPGIYAQVMLKTLQPRRMYARTLAARRDQVLEQVGALIRARVRQATSA